MGTNELHPLPPSVDYNRFGNAYAFTLENVQLFTSSSQPVPIAAALAELTAIAKIKLRFEEQENGDKWLNMLAKT